jgi:predicted nucleic acid-binding protein
MLVVDTSVIVPLYVRAAGTDAVRTLRQRDTIWRTDPFALIEFTNVLATYERAGYLTKAMAKECLAQAQTFLRPHYFTVTHETALELAIHHRLTAYDGRFLAVGQQDRPGLGPHS